MPRKDLKLSWVERTQQWRKYRKCKLTGRGVSHYLEPRGVKKSDHNAKLQAWKNWEAKLAEIEAIEEQGGEVGGMPDLSNAALMATNYKAIQFSPSQASLTILQTVEIEALIDTYLATKRQDAESGEISIQMYREHVDKLDDFRGFVRDVLGIKNINELNAVGLDHYRRTQLHLTTLTKEEGGRAPATVKKRLACVRQFLEWCFELEAIQSLPRNINRKFARVTLPEPKPKFFTVPEIKKLLKKADGQTKLYLLLALNCGFNPTCISTLHHEHIKWKESEIDRPRHKTNGRQRHRLWSETLELLKEHATQPDESLPGGGSVLLSTRGTPLVHEKIKDDKTSRTDTVGRQFTRLKDDLGMTGDNRGFKVLRSTSAEYVKDSHGPGVASIFLAHTEKETRRHYVSPDYSKLFEALEHLGKLYGVKL